MARLKVDAQELSDVQVSHVSLVKRGAIRVPFRILKSEGAGAMINLAQIFKSEPKAPTIAAVLVNKAADLDVAKARIEKAGLSVEQFDDSQDGVVIFPQTELGDITPGQAGSYIIKMDEMISCIVTNIEKAFEPVNFDSTSFDDVLAQEGMQPGIGLSMQVLGATVNNILAKAEDRETMVSDLTKALDAFKVHVVDMAAAVPENAFSMDFFKAEEFQVEKAEGEAAEEAADAEAEVAKDEAAEAPAVEEPVSEEAPVEAAAEVEEAAEDTGMADLVTQMAELAKSVAELTAMSKDTADKVEAQSKEISDAAALAKSAKDTLSKTVQGTPKADAAVTVEKDDQKRGDPPLMDTAFYRPGPLN